MSAAVPYSLLRTLRACLDGTADQPAWDRAKDELDDLLLAEPESLDGAGMVAEVERRIGGRFSPLDREVVASVLDEIRAEHDADAELPESPVVSAACSLCEAGHVPLTPCEPITDAEIAGYMAPGFEGDGDPC